MGVYKDINDLRFAMSRHVFHAHIHRFTFDDNFICSRNIFKTIQLMDVVFRPSPYLYSLNCNHYIIRHHHSSTPKA
jgi:hypothetical protein